MIPVETFYEWLAFGETGASSRTIVAEVTGDRRALGRWERWGNPPWDGDDMRRCLLLVRQYPQLRDEFDTIAQIDSTWAALIDHWDELESLLDEDFPGWDQPRWKWPYGRLRQSAYSRRFDEIFNLARAS